MSIEISPYPSYGNTQVTWLHEAPSHWDTMRLDRLFRLRNEPPEEGDNRVTGYIDGRVTLRSNVAGQKIKGVIHEGGWQRIYPGDFAISGMNAHLGGMGVSDSLGKCSPIYLVLEPRPGTNAQYVSLAVRQAAHLGAIKALVQTIRFNSADMKRADLKSIYVQIPPSEEQDAIVRFIRHIDQRVNRLLKTKRRLIELLNEQKQAIIHRAVTRGLDANVPFKPSGVAWLGDVPAHWEVKRAKQLFQEVDSRSGSGTEVLLSLRMYRGLVPHNEVSTVPIPPSSLINFKHIMPGQIVMNRMRAAIGMFGVATRSGLVSPDYAVFRPVASISPEYFVNVFKTRAAGDVFRIESKGLGTGSSGFMRLYTDRFGIIKLAVPPHDEQVAITNYIGNATREIDLVQDRTSREITLIREYRTRLVSDVVTGQLDVRGLALPEMDEAAVSLSDEAEALDEMPDEELEGVEA